MQHMPIVTDEDREFGESFGIDPEYAYVGASIVAIAATAVKAARDELSDVIQALTGEPVDGAKLARYTSAALLVGASSALRGNGEGPIEETLTELRAALDLAEEDKEGEAA